MPALNFRKEFAIPIVSEEKRHTIRARRKRSFKVGDRLYLYTGQRTQYCRKIREEDCVRVDGIRIYSDWKQVIINGENINMADIDVLAKRDGFKNTEDFFKFFGRHGNDFDGQLIWWKE